MVPTTQFIQKTALDDPPVSEGTWAQIVCLTICLRVKYDKKFQPSYKFSIRRTAVSGKYQASDLFLEPSPLFYPGMDPVRFGKGGGGGWGRCAHRDLVMVQGVTVDQVHLISRESASNQ